MSNTITLDSIREDINEKYAHTEVELGAGKVVRLTNPIRLSKAQREEFATLQKRLNDLGQAEDDEAEDGKASELDEDQLAEQVDLMRTMLTTVAETPAGGKQLLAAIDGLPEGDRVLAIASIVSQYQGQQGGASPSES